MNVSHSPGSLYDAYDVNITDIVEGMDIIRDSEFPGIEISAPTTNVYEFSSNIPIIAGRIFSLFTTGSFPPIKGECCG